MIQSEAYHYPIPRRDKANRHPIRKKKKEAAILRRNIRLGLAVADENCDERACGEPTASHPPTASSASDSRRRSFPGRHKWLGGAVDEETGKIYGVPSHSHHIVCITPPPPPPSPSKVPTSSETSETAAERTTVELIPLPNHDAKIREGSFKWLRGIVADGHLYGIPAWSDHGVLKMRLRAEDDGVAGRGGGRRPRVTLLPLPDAGAGSGSEVDRGGTGTGTGSVDLTRWMWHGGALSHRDPSCPSVSSAAIYCIPSNADRVLKINVRTEEVAFVGPKMRGSNKWYGGIKGKDGCVYGMPYAAKGVLRIDPRCDSVEVLGDYPEGGYKWHGGLLAHSTGTIYAFPAHADEVLCVDTNVHRPATARSKDTDVDGVDGPSREQTGDDGDQSWRVYTIPIRRDPGDTDPPDLQYKWLGGAYGADGCIYGMPSDATSILRIDPSKNEASTFAKVSNTKNKWQGGVLSPIDNCVYAVPADSDCILKIDTDPSTPPRVDTTIGTDVLYSGSSSSDMTDKWQGGFLARDGNIYGIPENFNRVMKLTPGENPRLNFLT